jgi:tetratricopeptide (TPR) repeat protein
MGSFIDLYGDFRVDVRVVNVETSEIIKTEKLSMQREHLFDLVRGLAGALNKDLNLPPLSRQVSDQRMSRQVPTEALTFYSRALLYHDRGQKDKAIEMYQRAISVFPQYTEAQDGLRREQNS